jgi:hypothetical protein
VRAVGRREEREDSEMLMRMCLGSVKAEREVL